MSMKTYYQMSEEEIRQEVNQGSQPLTVDQVRNRQKDRGGKEKFVGDIRRTISRFSSDYSDDICGSFLDLG